MKKLICLLSVFLFLCGCGADTMEESGVAESLESSSVTIEEPDVYLDADGKLCFGDTQFKTKRNLWLLAYVEDRIYFKIQDPDDEQRVTIYKADLNAHEITAVGIIEHYRISTRPHDVRRIDQKLYFTVACDEEKGGKVHETLFSIDLVTDTLHTYEGERLISPLVYHQTYGGKLFTLKTKAVDGYYTSYIEKFDPAENTAETILSEKIADILAFTVDNGLLYLMEKNEQERWELLCYDLDGVLQNRFDLSDAQEDMGDYKIAQICVTNGYFLVSNLIELKIFKILDDTLHLVANGWASEFYTANYNEKLPEENIFIYSAREQTFLFNPIEATLSQLVLPFIKYPETQIVTEAFESDGTVLLCVGDIMAKKNSYYILPEEKLKEFVVQTNRIKDEEVLHFLGEKEEVIIIE